MGKVFSTPALHHIHIPMTLEFVLCHTNLGAIREYQGRGSEVRCLFLEAHSGLVEGGTEEAAFQKGVGLIQKRVSESLTGPWQKRDPLSFKNSGRLKPWSWNQSPHPSSTLPPCVIMGMPATLQTQFPHLQNGDSNAFCQMAIVKMPHV